MQDATQRTLIRSIPVGSRLAKVVVLAHEAREPVLLEGPTGIGKSELLEQVARWLGIGYALLDLSILEPSDLVGLPMLVDGVTIWAPPACLPRAGSGLLVIEEINRAERHILAPMLQLLTARCLHQYRLPEGWTIAAAINPETVDYDVNPLDRALRARFLRVAVHADRPTWLEWASANGIHPAILRLAHEQDQIFADVPPRTWTKASNLLLRMTPEQRRDPEFVRDVLGGTLPAAWLELVLQDGLLRSEDGGLDARTLLAGYDSDPALRKTLLGLAHAGRTDCIDRAYRQLHALLSGPALAEGEIRLGAFERLVHDLPGDHREGLQEAFGQHPAAARLLDLHPVRVLPQYARSRWRPLVKAWLADRRLSYRVAALLSAVARYVEHADLDELRRPAILRGLGHLIHDVGPERSQALRETLLRRGLSLPPPR